MDQELLYFNGINGTTGRYGLPPMTSRKLADHIAGDEDKIPENLAELYGKLASDTLDKVLGINKSLLSGDNAQALEENAASRNAWLEVLAQKLMEMPIDVINNSVSKGTVTRQVNSLIQGLKRASQVDNAPGDTVFEALTQDLEALSSPQQQPSRVSWNDLVQALAGRLRLEFTSPNIHWRDLLDTLNRWLSLLAAEIGHAGVKEGVDPNDLAQAGWGIIFGANNPLVPKIKAALAPLLNLRQSEAGARFRVYEGPDGYHPGDTARTFMGRQSVDPTVPVDPDRAPFYLLIVGDPEEIPFSFMNQLDVQFAVGRIDFDDMEAYARYARGVVEAEKQGFNLAPRATFFGVANPEDLATNLSVNKLVRPLYEHLKARYADWQMEAVLEDDAKKARLGRLAGGDETPALLFTASHGMEFPQDDPQQRQVRHQGALLCQDWPGPDAWHGEIPHDYYFAGDDLANDANMLGTIAFFFACFSGGTPLYDEFSKQAFKTNREVIAEHPFVAALPKAMLSLPKGGALAVVAHVERAWGTSFLGPRQTEQIVVFESAIERLLKGHRVGSAMDYFNARYAALAAELCQQLESIEFGLIYDPYELAGLWTANNDTRGYIVIGDPAVRLRVATSGLPNAARPVVESQPATAPAALPEARAAERPYTEQEWQQTPPAVQAYIRRLEAQLR